MSKYAQEIMQLRAQYEQSKMLKEKVDSLVEKLSDLNNQYVVYLEAQQLLATVSDSNTTAILDYITGIINKALSELFPYDVRHIYLEKKMFNGQHAHINVRLVNSSGRVRDLALQSGTGLRQVVSFLFVVSLIEIRKGRRILLMDELLSGLHDHAKRIILDIISIFAEDGFQFIMVEYGVLNFGKTYLAEKPDKTSTLTPIDGDYNDEIFMFNPPVMEIDKSIVVDEG